MNKRFWKRFCFELKYPYGYCETHKTKKESFIGCLECCQESWKRVAHQEREEKIEIIKEAILRARGC